MYVALAIFTAIFVVWLFRRKRFGHLPPGPKGYPFLGVASELKLLTAHQVVPKWAETFGPLFSFTVMGLPSLVISDAKLVRKAFLDDEFKALFNDRPPTFVGKYIMFNYSDMGWSMSEISSKLKRAFHKGIHLYGDGIPKFERLVTREINRFIGDLEGLDGKEVAPRPLVETTICMNIAILLAGELDVTCVTETKKMMYLFIEPLNRLGDPVYDSVLQAAPFLRLLPGPVGKLYRDTIRSRDTNLDHFFRKQKSTFREDENRGLVDALLSVQNEQIANASSDAFLTDDCIKAMILNTISAGVVTSTNTLLWILLALLNNPDCLERLRKEVDAVVGRDRCPLLSDRAHLPYAEAVLLETLRITALLPFLLAHKCSKDVHFEGYDIPKDTMVLIDTWTIHHDKKIWGDPDTFRPDRFLDEDGQVLSPLHPQRQLFLMFGLGKRHCPGETLAKSRIPLYLATLMQKFDIQPTASLTPLDPQKNGGGGIILEAPAFTCRFIPRQ